MMTHAHAGEEFLVPVRTPRKPHNLTRWALTDSPDWSFWTCARPGRHRGPSADVPDEDVHLWVTSMLEHLDRRPLVLVSLLGRKETGKSEFSFYSFHGGYDVPGESSGGFFAAWLARHYPDVVLVEHPTTDAVPVPDEVVSAVEVDIWHFTEAGAAVVIFDSFGLVRTGEVAQAIGAQPVSRGWA